MKANSRVGECQIYLLIYQLLLVCNETKFLLQKNIVKNLSSIKIPLWILTIMVFFHLFK